MAVTDFSGQFARLGQIHRIDPIDVRSQQGPRKQIRMVIALANDQLVVLQVFDQHIPRLVPGIFQAADAQTLTLADGVVHQAMVAADDFTFGGLDLARLGRQVLLEEIAEAAFADKADTGGILFLRGGQVVFLGNRAYFGFFEFADREQRLGDLFATHGVQEVALVLVRIQALEQFGTAVDVAATNIMAGSDQVGAEHHGVVEERLELDFAVAEDVRVWGATGLVFGQEVLEHVVPVLGGEVGGVQLDANLVANGLGVRQVVHGGAVFRSIVFFPVLHEQAFHLIALLDQQESGNGGVHAAGHADNDALLLCVRRGWITHRDSTSVLKKDAILAGPRPQG